VKKLFDGVEDVRTTDVPVDLFDVTFVRQLILGTNRTLRNLNEVIELHRDFPEYLASVQRYPGDTNIFTFAAQKYLTNMKNHMRVYLHRFMGRTLKALHPNLTGAQQGLDRNTWRRSGRV